MSKSLRLLALWVAGLSFSLAAQAAPYLLSGTFGTTVYTGPLNGGTFSGSFEFTRPAVGAFDIVLRDASDNVLAELTNANASAQFVADAGGNGVADILQFFTNTGPLNFLSVIFDIGFTGEGAVLAFPANLPYSSFAGIGGNTAATDSIVTSGVSVSAAIPEPASLALVGLGLLGAAAVRRKRAA